MRIICGAFVDDEDYDRLIKYPWKIENNGNTQYAFFFRKLRHGRKGIRVYMHRFILGIAAKGKVVDHIDGNGMNNRKCNLRAVTQQENSMNRHPKGTVQTVLPTEEENEQERLQWLMKKDLAEIEKTAKRMKEAGAPDEIVSEFIKEEKAKKGLD